MLSESVGASSPPQHTPPYAADLRTQNEDLSLSAFDVTSTDSLLLQGIIHRQESALALLYDRYIRLVHAIAVRITQDRAQAEEVVQDVFHAIWRDAPSFDKDREVLPWLLSITQHRAIDTTRGRNYWHHAHTITLYEEIHADATHPTDVIVDRLQLQAALSILPYDQRLAVQLAYYQGLTSAQIADSQSIPLGTAKARLRLALTKMRELLIQWQHKDGISQR